MKRINRTLRPGAIAIMVLMGLFSFNCEKVEPERLILIRTGAVTEVTPTTCVAGGILLDVGTAGVDQHGFCWSTTPDPDNRAGFTEQGRRSEKYSFSGTITGLNPGTDYHIWAYASSGEFVKYGDYQTFRTLSVEPPTISTGAVINITGHSVQCGGLVLSDGGAVITEKGVCWNTSPSPTPEHFHKVDESGLAEFGVEVDGLTPGATYYIRAYATNSVGTGYGNELSFATLAGPVLAQLTTGPIENITWNSAQGGGNITSDGGSEVTARGVCWNTSPEPTVYHAKTTDGTGPGEFASSLAPLNPETKYYVRAYATNGAGTAYGNEEVFSTIPEPVVPEVVTHGVTSIEHTGATGGGTISSDGGAPILSKGLCWSALVEEPTLADEHLEYGDNADPFSMEISGLDQNTLYHVRAYATNVAGTGYGEPVAFKTLFLCGSQLVDERDGQGYFTVSIGEQCWMAENLNAGLKIDTSSVMSNNSTLEKYCYDDDPGNCDTYGGLYSWDEMMQYTLIESTQGVCPAGWHIPSDLEWKILERNLGMTDLESDETLWRGTDEGGKLKAGGTSYWNPPNAGATNSTLFSALPAGMVWNDGSSTGLGDFAVFWTSTPIVETQAWYRYLHTDESRIYRVDGYRPNTTSVRCVKD